MAGAAQRKQAPVTPEREALAIAIIEGDAANAACAALAEASIAATQSRWDLGGIAVKAEERLRQAGPHAPPGAERELRAALEAAVRAYEDAKVAMAVAADRLPDVERARDAAERKREQAARAVMRAELADGVARLALATCQQLKDAAASVAKLRAAVDSGIVGEGLPSVKAAMDLGAKLQVSVAVVGDPWRATFVALMANAAAELPL